MATTKKTASTKKVEEKATAKKVTAKKTAEKAPVKTAAPAKRTEQGISTPGKGGGYE